MSDIAIHVENLGKLYRIGERQRYKALRDTLSSALYAPFRAAASLFNGHGPTAPRRSSNQDFWSLKNVSFDIKKGEAVGIIGRNGAGKSTLLKILSRITKPTEGYVEIRGRVGSLLEVGTGFHPELTGRENAFLNGAIIGMKKKEIDRKFDEIVAFAEIEKFLDTPVKFYSSGMYIRLAFAVAAHLEPEILLVDEVLAVGDTAFQKKCLGKMGDVAKGGRTVLFVSHNVAAIQSLCVKGLLLNAGQLIGQGSAHKIVQDYVQSNLSTETVSVEQRTDRAGDGSVRVVSLQIESMDPDKVIRSTSRLKFRISYRSERSILHPQILIGVYDYTNVGIYLFDSDAVGDLPESLPSEGNVTCATDHINLTPGRCYVNIAVKRGGAMADYIQYAASFDVEIDDIYGTGKIPPRTRMLCVLRHKWSLNESGGPYEDVLR